MTDDWGEEATPSQAALDQQLQGQAALQRAEAQGRINLARGHIMEAASEGGSTETARELLGRLDVLERDPEAEDAADLYGHYRAFVKGAGRAQPLAAAPGKATGAAPARPADKNKARRDYADGKISTAEARKLGIV